MAVSGCQLWYRQAAVQNTNSMEESRLTFKGLEWIFGDRVKLTFPLQC